MRKIVKTGRRGIKEREKRHDGKNMSTGEKQAKTWPREYEFPLKKKLTKKLSASVNKSIRNAHREKGKFI